VRGYREALAAGAGVVVKVDGDGQMDGAEVVTLVTPLVEGEADMVVGNRMGCPGTRGNIPWVRRAGIRALAVLTSGPRGCGWRMPSAGSTR
jgi:hypothetical protein